MSTLVNSMHIHICTLMFPPQRKSMYQQTVYSNKLQFIVILKPKKVCSLPARNFFKRRVQKTSHFCMKTYLIWKMIGGSKSLNQKNHKFPALLAVSYSKPFWRRRIWRSSWSRQSHYRKPLHRPWGIIYQSDKKSKVRRTCYFSSPFWGIILFELIFRKTQPQTLT